MTTIITKEYKVPPYERHPPTKGSLDWANLAEIDLGKWSRPGGKQELAHDLRHAVTEVGFWYVVNSGITDERVLRQMAIGNAFLNLPLEEKMKYPCDFANGNYFGFRSNNREHGQSGVKDNAEALNLPKFTPSLEHEYLDYDFIKAHHDEILEFQKDVHQKIIVPLLSIFAIILELPEGYFLKPHAFERATEDHLRYMRYTPRPEDIDKKVDNVHLPGHTDFGIITLLFAQSVAGLQIKTPEEAWKYVPYLPNGVLINTADVLSFLTGGFLKSTIHRVVRPPKDQENLERMGLFYFSRAANDLDMRVAPSPVLEKLGLYKHEDVPENPIKGIDWTRGRVKHNWNRTKMYTDDYIEGFKIGNLKVQTYHA